MFGGYVRLGICVGARALWDAAASDASSILEVERLQNKTLLNLLSTANNDLRIVKEVLKATGHRWSEIGSQS